jgi:hypothetical protein
VLGAVIGLQKVLVHMINSDTLQCRKVFKAVHNCLHLLLEATADLKVDSSETDESHSESGSDDNGDDEDGDSDSKDVCLILLNINSKQAKVLSSFGKLSL